MPKGGNGGGMAKGPKKILGIWRGELIAGTDGIDADFGRGRSKIDIHHDLDWAGAPAMAVGIGSAFRLGRESNAGVGGETGISLSGKASANRADPRWRRWCIQDPSGRVICADMRWAKA